MRGYVPLANFHRIVESCISSHVFSGQSKIQWLKESISIYWMLLEPYCFSPRCLSYIGECVAAATFLVNRLPSTILKFDSPYHICLVNSLTIIACESLGVCAMLHHFLEAEQSLNLKPFLLCSWVTRLATKVTNYTISRFVNFSFQGMLTFMRIFFLPVQFWAPSWLYLWCCFTMSYEWCFTTYKHSTPSSTTITPCCHFTWAPFSTQPS